MEDLIEQATELFKAREKNGVHYGILYPSPKSVWSYGRPAVSWYAKVEQYLVETHTYEGNFKFLACISSIDDSGMTIWGPLEPEEKAKARLEEFLLFLKSCEFRCPTHEDMNAYDKIAGTYTDIW